MRVYDIEWDIDIKEIESMFIYEFLPTECADLLNISESQWERMYLLEKGMFVRQYYAKHPDQLYELLFLPDEDEIPKMDVDEVAQFLCDEYGYYVKSFSIGYDS